MGIILNNNDSGKPIDLTRRKLLAGIAATAGAAGLTASCGSSDGTGSDGSTGGAPQLQTLPPPDQSGIDHIIVVMMENRSVDHYFGWVPGANGQQPGLSFTDTAGNSQSTHDLAPNFQNCTLADPDHSYEGGRI